MQLKHGKGLIVNPIAGGNFDTCCDFMCSYMIASGCMPTSFKDEICLLDACFLIRRIDVVQC